MPNPATFPPLELDGYTVTWDERTPSDETKHYEHGVIDLPNGYSVSVARTDLDEPVSVGFENGRWEAALMKPNADPIAKMFGQIYTKAEELDDLTTHEVGGWKVVGDLDNAGIQALLETVAQRPVVEVEDVLPTDEDMDAFFLDLFGPADEEEEQA